MVSPAYAVNGVLDDLGIHSASDLRYLDLIAFARGAVVRRRSLHGAEARLTVLGTRSVITISDSISNPQRQRFSVGHELGHLEMHRFRRKVFFCVAEDISDWQGQRVEASLEKEANEFAAALLMPERFFVPSCDDTDPCWETVEKLAEEFDTSLTATALRYVQFCETPCAVVFVQNCRVRWFRGSTSFRESGAFIDVRARLDPATMTSRYLGGGSVRMQPHRVNASTWLQNWRPGQGSSVMEQYRPYPAADAVLSLIWFDSDSSAYLLQGL